MDTLLNHFGKFCSYFMIKSYDFNNSITKTAFGAIKRSNSTIYSNYVYLNENFDNLFEFESFLNGFLEVYKHLSNEFTKDNNIFKNNKNKDIFLFLDYLLSNEFKKTNFSKQLTTLNFNSLNDYKINFNKIYNNQQTPSDSNTPLTPTASSSAAAINTNDSSDIGTRITSLENMFKAFMANQVNNTQTQVSNVQFSNTNNTQNTLAPEQVKSKLKNLIRTLKIKLNHIETNEKHLEKETTPASLFYNRLPSPFLSDNQLFIDEYNALCKKFQSDTLNLTNVHLQIETESIETEINELKSKYSDIVKSDLISDTNSALEKELSTHFEKKLTKLNNITAVPFKVTKHSPISERKPYKINNWHSQRKNNNKFSSTPKRARYSNNNSNNSHRNRSSNNESLNTSSDSFKSNRSKSNGRHSNNPKYNNHKHNSNHRNKYNKSKNNSHFKRH